MWRHGHLFLFAFVSLCSPGCPGIHSVDQAGLELRNLPASTPGTCFVFALCVWVFCLHLCLHTMSEPGALWGQTRVSGPWNCNYRCLWVTMKMLRIESRFSGKAVGTLACLTGLFLFWFFKKNYLLYVKYTAAVFRHFFLLLALAPLPCCSCLQTSQKRVSDLITDVWLLGLEPTTFGRAVGALNHWAISIGAILIQTTIPGLSGVSGKEMCKFGA